MPLTPEDVSNKRFTTVRLREGYDMTEVDQFLDEVEAELARMTREADELRAKLHTAQNGEPPGPLRATRPAKPSPRSRPKAAAEPSGGRPAETPAAPRRSRDPPGHHHGGGLGRRHPAARARRQQRRRARRRGPGARPSRSSARRRPTRSVARRRARSGRQARDRRPHPPQALEAETAERRTPLMGDLEQEKSGLDAEIENLRTFEREYRSRAEDLLRGSSSPRWTAAATAHRARRPASDAARGPAATAGPAAARAERARDEHEAGVPSTWGAPASAPCRQHPGHRRSAPDRRSRPTRPAGAGPSAAESRRRHRPVALAHLGGEHLARRPGRRAHAAPRRSRRRPATPARSGRRPRTRWSCGPPGPAAPPRGPARRAPAPGSARGRARPSRPAR